MQDLGAYGLIAQCFEFLVTLGDDGELAPGLAESWEPNEDGTVWTFKLRQGVKWQDGGDFTSADVAATMDRLVDAANAGLAGVIAEGAVDTTDPNVAVFNLEGANGNFPYLVSVFNAQTLITPVDYETGTTLDGTPNGTGPWKLDQLRPGHRRDVRAQPRLVGRPDAARRPGGAVLRRRRHDGHGDAGRRRRRPRPVLGARRRRAAQQPRLHGARGASRRPTARSGCAATPASSSTRRVRQALAFTFDREQMVRRCSRVGPRSPTTTSSPRSCRSSTRRSRRSGSKDIDMAKQLLADAGVERPAGRRCTPPSCRRSPSSPS